MSESDEERASRLADLANFANEHALPSWAIQHLLDGNAPADVLATVKLRKQIAELAPLYIGQPPDAWPIANLAWDLRTTSQHYSLDGEGRAAFEKRFPDGFELVWTRLDALDASLHPQSARAPDELWTVGVREKVAEVIAFLALGYEISPPYVVPHDNKIVIGGGHHRLAVARALCVQEVPLYVAKSEREALLKILAAASSR